jgi:hypothetical protein
VRKLGLDDEAIVELMAVIDLFSGFNNLLPMKSHGMAEARYSQRRARSKKSLQEVHQVGK